MASRSSRMQPNWTTVSAVWGPSSRGSIARRAVSGVAGSGSAVGRLSRTTCGIVSSMSVALQASDGRREREEDVLCCRRHFALPAGRQVLGWQCSTSGLTRQREQRFNMFEQQCTGPLGDVCGPMGWFVAWLGLEPAKTQLAS